MNKSPSQAVRKLAVVPAFGGNQSLSDVVRAAAGHTEAKQDVLLGAVYTAYVNALKHGNKNQLQGRESSLFEQAKMYSVSAKAKAAGFPQPKKAADYYSAHLCALEGVGMPGKLTTEQAADAAMVAGGVTSVEAIAEGMALAYVGMVDTYLADLAKTAADKRAASKATAATGKAAEKADADGVAAADAVATAQQAINAQAITMPTLVDMVAAVAAALRTGVISDAEAGVLADAADEYNSLMQVRETAALLSTPVASVSAQAEAVQ